MHAADLVSRSVVSALEEVGHVPAAELRPARLQLHHAAQVVASVGFSFLEPAEDFSHTTLQWLDAGHQLLGRPTPDDHPVQGGLSLPGLSLRVRSATGHVRASLDLHGGPARAEALAAFLSAAHDAASTLLQQGRVTR